MSKPSILLAYGEREFSRLLKEDLLGRGYNVALLPKGPPPAASYDFLFQLARDASNLIEGTRLLLEKASKDHARFFLLTFQTEEKLYEEALRFATSLLKEEERHLGLEVNILNLGRIFGSGISEKDSGALGHLLKEFAEGEVLTLYGKGEDADYYLFIGDALNGIGEAVVRAKPGASYALSPAIATTSEELAKILVKLGGGRHEIRFHHGLIAAGAGGKIEGVPLADWLPKTSLREGILTVLKELPKPHSTKAQQGWRLPPFSIHLNISWRPPTFRLTPATALKALRKAALILLLASPFLYLFTEVGLIFTNFNTAKAALARFDFPRASTAAQSSADGLKRLSFFLSPLEAGVDIASATAELSLRGDVALRTFENLRQSYRGEAVKPESEEEFRRLALAFSSAEDRLSLAWLELNQLGSPWRSYLSPAKDGLKEALPALRLGRAISAEAPDLLGYRGERHYLIFFQNSAELWAGGGVAGSLAQLTLENGGIKKLAFFDIYDFSQYKDVYQTPLVLGTVPSPATNVSLSPDFSQNAKIFAGVFERANNVKISGIIGVDLHFAEKFLRATGPLKLTDFDKEVTADNLFVTTTQEVEKEFFPGSTKKKRFLQALGEGVLTKFFALERKNYAAVGELAWGELKGKGILLYFLNPEIYQAAIENNFAGLVADPPAGGGGDYLFPLDHNGGTKGTVWVKRKINYKVFNSDREGTLRGELAINWRNVGTSSWPAGNYKNFFRVLVPKGAKLLSANLDSEDVLKRMVVSEEAGKGSFAIAFEIEPQTFKTLKLAYDLPPLINLKNLTDYQLTLQKQPGTEGESFQFTFEKPLGFTIKGEGLQEEGKQLIFKGALDGDQHLSIQLKKE